MIVLDTNVLSEPLRTQPDEHVLTWLSALDELIDDVLCRFIPSTMPDQVAVVWPARYADGEVVIHAMKLHRWEASRRDRTATTIIPVPLHGSPAGPAFDIDPPDPWSKRLAAALQAGPAVPGIMDARLPDGFEFAVAPSSPLAMTMPLHLDN